MKIALLFILVFWSDDSGYRLFQILWIQGFYHSMLSILHQIHIFVNFRLGSSQPSLYTSNCIRTKLSRCILVKPDCHWPTCLWPLSSSHYSGYPIKKLTSITRKGGQLCLIGFSTLSPTVVLKGSKPHALTNRQSVDRLDNLSCICISEWEYTFRVIYILRWRRHLFI